MEKDWGSLKVLPSAPSRIMGHGPISIIDIGSNSVRLVTYERLSRSPTPLFNEKALCGLGRGLHKSGRLDDEAVESALSALHRFKIISDHLGSVDLHVLATAAVREAENGSEFMELVADITAVQPTVLSGQKEAWYSAHGVLSGIYQADGVVGDMGGGSLEIAAVANARVGEGATYPLGGLRLQEVSSESPAKAYKLALEALKTDKLLKNHKKKSFYAIGGTWRSLALLHMKQKTYPLNVLHHYSISSKNMLQFCKGLMEADLEKVDQISFVSKNRRTLLPYGAATMRAILEVQKPETVVISALGIREGLLYTLLDQQEREQDGLIAGAEELSLLRSRSPAYTSELISWTSNLMEMSRMEETEERRRLRIAACLLCDLGWRAHPDYRGLQSLNMIAHAAFIGIDHQSRAFIALAAYFRHAGQVDEEELPDFASLLSDEWLQLARILGHSFRIAYLLSAAMPGMLQHSAFSREGDTLFLCIDETHAGYVGERLMRRLAQIGKLLNLDTDFKICDLSSL